MKEGVYISVQGRFCSCKIDIQYIHVHNRLNEEDGEGIGKKIKLERLRLYGQANKRIRRMPRRQEAMKDVTVCEKLRGVDNQVLIRRCPNGETRPTTQLLCN